MKKEKRIDAALLFIIILIFGLVLLNVIKKKNGVDTYSGATPVALERKAPEGLSLTIDGKVKQTYRFTGESFQRMANIRIRTPEVSPGGEILGAYIYTGIPVLYIMEGIVAEKKESDVFDRPLDMVVIFTSYSGKTSCFSYGELTTANDSLPIILAYHREPILPSKDPGKYDRNKYPENITGLRLVCPREPDTARYLDNVVRMTFKRPATPDELLPPMQKNKKCSSNSVECVEGQNKWPASFEDVPVKEISGWFRIGHGRGIKGDSRYTASGYHLSTFLKRNFPGCTAGDFFIFVACDGYRSIFSGSEMFRTSAGDSFLLLKTLNGEPPKDGITVGAIGDFFVDRCVRGLTHIVRVKPAGSQF
ncbi:MAG: hypothetical protein KAT34_01490 [Candidatus Aminicenantes bacterium]|nr:hypothetical protein [Candidatus Aminicenantes bacterium]